jgi:orotate phosphoribosyltransferase
MTTTAEKIAGMLLDIHAVALQPNDPFTWTSGLKSPIYCDNRLTMSYPEVRRAVAKAFAEEIQDKFGEVDVIAGTATGAIAHAAWVSEELDLPMVYIRDKAKAHGKKNQIEGKLDEGDKVLVLEDTVSTGGSVLKAVEAVREAGGQVVGVAAIFSYLFNKTLDDFKEKDVPLLTLSDYPTLLKVAAEKGLIEHDDLTKLQAWRENPQSYGV